MAPKHLALALMAVAAPLAAQPYQYPVHQDASLNNYGSTGFQAAKSPMRFSSKEQIQVGSTIMANDRYHRIWTKVGEDDYKYYSMIARLDRLKVLDLNGGDENKYIKVEIESSSDRRLIGKEFYTRIIGLSEYGDFKDFDADVYMVQNIATEKIRVYQRICKDNSCPPKMIFETDFVAGLKKGDDDYKYNTHVGNYRIFEWEKFYQDKGSGGHYPSWFDPSYPEQPGPDDSWSAWFDDEVMPWEYCETVDGEKKCSYNGMMRGAFGWYTALVEPHYGTGQWTHGTIGWAQSSTENLYRAKGEDFLGRLANMVTSLRSSGCSRVSNPSVAFLRHILPVGTPLIKIYALESYQDQASMEANYNVGSTNTWDFILTKDGVRQTGEAATTAHKNYVMQNRLDTPDNIIEEGTYEFKTYPTVVQYQYKPRSSGNGYRRSRGCVEDTVDNYPKAGQRIEDRSLYDIDNEDKIRSRQCNVYKIDADKFVGRFYVDTGLIDGYDHPQADGVIRGGFRSQKFPSFLNVKNYK